MGAASRVTDLLARQYGLAVTQVVPGRRGWTGETYVATTQDEERVFVKVYPSDRLPPTAAPGLPVLAEMHRAGLPVNRPVPSTSGALYEWLGDDLVVVFEYLDAEPAPFTFGGERFGDLIANVHRQTERIVGEVAGSRQQSQWVDGPISRETFSPVFADEIWRTLARTREEPALDEPRRGLRRFVEERRAELIERWGIFEEIARACRAASFEMVLTHGDWPFNLLQHENGAITLIDWDELLLAPPERDTWYADDEPELWRGYRARRNGHEPSPLATAYYVHFRYFEELVSFAGTILGDDPIERRAWSLALLDGEWMTGLRTRMERHSRPR